MEPVAYLISASCLILAVIAEPEDFEKYLKNNQEVCAVDVPFSVISMDPGIGPACIPPIVRCGWECKKTPNCTDFNFKSTGNLCELFVKFPKSFSTISGCTHFKNSAPVICPAPGADLARGGDSSMSSEAIGSSEVIVDGVSTNCTGVYRSCTEAQQDPWFAVDLGTERSVGYVNIINDATGHGQTTITSSGGYTHRFGVDGTILNMDVTTNTTYVINPSAQMIAMRCDGQGGARGRCLAGSVDGWIKTNVTWKCLDYPQSNWWTLSCDPSSWPNAVELGSNNGSFAPQVAGISADAMWITSKVFSTAVYCRVFLVPQLHNFQVGLSNVNPASFPPTPTSYQLCATYTGTIGAGMSVNITCTASTGTYRYVIVQIPGASESLCLCEVAVNPRPGSC